MKERWLIIFFAFAITVNLIPVFAGIISMPAYYQGVVTQTAVVPTSGSGFTKDSLAQEAAERGVSLETYAASRIALLTITTLILLGVASLLIWRAKGQWFAWYTASLFVFFASSALNEITLIANVIPWRMLGFIVLFWTMLAPYIYFFPDGRAVPRRALWVIVPLTIYHFVIQVLTALAYYIPEMEAQGAGINWRTGQGILIQPVIIGFLFALGCQVYRYARASTPEQRQQAKWFVFGLGFFLLTTFVGVFTGGRGGWVDDLVGTLLALAGLPVALTIAVLRYRLWDIDIIINRALVYATLTAITIGMYVAIVGALSVVFQTSGNPIAFFLATGIVAVLFQPIREHVQRGVNRLMYGERDDPYAVLSRLGQRLETALEPNAVLPTIVETIARALKLPFVEIRPRDAKLRVVSFGEHRRTTVALPLTYQNELLGELHVAPRAGEQLSDADQNLLRDVARQTGIAIHAARVTADLQRSREQLVLAREEERRRLRRDLHDDLAPTLASLGLTASTAADLIPSNPMRATALVKELHTEIRSTVGNIRRLVYDLRPPTLDEFGLFAAVRERATQYSNAPDGFAVTVDAPAELPALPAAVEVAAYRITQEALENVARHSEARQCSIRFAIGNALEIEVTDDGMGLPQSITPGIGLRSMRERAEELGGSCVIERGASVGTRVYACLPIANYEALKRLD